MPKHALFWINLVNVIFNSFFMLAVIGTTYSHLTAFFALMALISLVGLGAEYSLNRQRKEKKWKELV